jgi:hypothetical protein
MGGGADAGACLGSLIGHQDHRMMTFQTGRTFLFTGFIVAVIAEKPVSWSCRQ